MLLCFLATGVLTAEQLPPIEEPLPLTAEGYWLYEAYAGITGQVEENGYLTGYIALILPQRFRVPLEGLNDVGSRTRGYRKAVETWYSVLKTTRASPQAEQRRIQARHRLAELTGQDLDEPSAWGRWIGDNLEYLRWSGREGVLVIDDAAKASGKPVLQRYSEITAVDYWYYQTRGELHDVREIDEYTVSKFLVHPDHILKVRVSTEEIKSREAKLEGYIRALNEYVDLLRNSPVPPAIWKQRLKWLRSLIGGDLRSSETLIAWYDSNKDRLVLSEDGEQLVVGVAPIAEGAD